MKNFMDKRKFGQKRSFGGGGGDRSDRPMYDAVCDKCGQDCKVPFQPSSGKGVLCSSCFEKSGGRDARPTRFGDRRPSGGGGFELKEISAKLDRIIELLASKN